jgi:HJR/Mrr/RecB family endonuclease
MSLRFFIYSIFLIYILSSQLIMGSYSEAKLFPLSKMDMYSGQQEETIIYSIQVLTQDAICELHACPINWKNKTKPRDLFFKIQSLGNRIYNQQNEMSALRQFHQLILAAGIDTKRQKVQLLRQKISPQDYQRHGKVINQYIIHETPSEL